MSTITIDLTAGAPSQTPPDAGSVAASASTAGTSAPTLAAGTNGTAMTVTPPSAPTLDPSSALRTQQAGAVQAVTGTWRNGATVSATWAANEVRNAFMNVTGVGWVKIFNGTDAAFTALTCLAAQAHQTGKTINYRVESDGMAHEIYLW